MSPFAAIGRFTLRDFLPWEAPELLSLFGDAQTVRYMGVSQLHDLVDAARTLERLSKSQTKWQAVCDDNKFLGIVGFEIQGHTATVVIAFKHTARGAGRAFSTPFVQWLFTHPGIWRIWAYCHVDNVPVQRVLERMGAKREGRLRRFAFFPNISSEPQDVYSYSIVR